MAMPDHNGVHVQREADNSTRINDPIAQRDRIAARFWRRAVRHARSPREMSKLEFEANAR